MVEITLFQRDVSPCGVTMVDDQDADLAHFRWSLDKRGRGYAFRTLPNESGRGRRRKISLSRVILTRMLGELPHSMECDHIDRVSLNNRRTNLRGVTHYQNMLNRGGWSRKDAFKSSQYKGVRWDKENNKWAVRIVLHGVRKRGGRFWSEQEAAHAYDRLAQEHFGEFACLNFPA
jgi:hypothetical protein